MLGIVKDSFLETIANFCKIRRKPHIIQLPITSRCNSRCVTCNVWKCNDNIDIDSIELTRIFSQPFFNKVIGVGVNGGEITLVKNIDRVISAVLTLPKLKVIYVISNGLLPDKLLATMALIKQMASAKGVKVSLQLSVDGYGEVHEKTRGVPGCFPRTEKVLMAMYENQQAYCDMFSVGCTLSQSNIAYVRQLDEYLKRYAFSVYYHLAVPNKRIHTFCNADNYYVLGDRRSQLLAETFFYEQMIQTSFHKNRVEKMQLYTIYKFLKHNGTRRLNHCSYKLRDLTIDENLNIYLCATASDSFGNLRENDGAELIKTQKCKQVLCDVSKECATCIHYAYTPTLRGLISFYAFVVRNHFLTRKFK